MGKVLIVADMDSEPVAIPRGLWLAATLAHDVEVVAFTHADLDAAKIPLAERAALRKRLLAERDAAVRSQIDGYRRPGQQIDLSVVWEKHIHHWLNKHCASRRYAMVIKTGNRSESLVHTSTDWQLLRECPAPLLLVAKKKWHKIKPVLVTLDLASTATAKQALNHKVLGVGRVLAQALGVELEIISAVEIPAWMTDLDLVDPVAYVRNAGEAMKPHIVQLARAHGMPESAFHYKRGAVEKVITSRAAQVRAQIVVMGTVARKGVKARLLGNTAERVLRHLKTDVLALKP